MPTSAGSSRARSTATSNVIGRIRETAHVAAPQSKNQSRLARLVEIGVDNSLLVALVAAVGTTMIGCAPQLFIVDSWMTLVAGREIVEHGLPHREALTVLAQGRTWIDQQWLAQLAYYGADALAGLRATLLLHALFVTTATALAIVAARRRGGTARSTLLVTFVCVFFGNVIVGARAQALALPLFVATLALLASDRQLLRRRTLLVFPLLVIWANVHGSVVVGAAIVTWAGLIDLGEIALRRPTRATPWRSAALLALPWLCVLATPYGTAVAGYYKLMFVDSPVARVVPEWQSPRPHGLQLGFFLIAAMTLVIALLGRRRLSIFDLGVLALTLAGALRSARGIPWFALAVAVLLPVALDAILPPERAPIRRRLGLLTCIGSCAVLGAALAHLAPRGDGWYESEMSSGGAHAVAVALPELPPGPAVVPSVRHADWLLWKVPALRGRIAYDIRYELLTARELRSVARLKTSKPGWERAAAGYPIVVLDPTEDPRRTSLLLREPGARLLYRDHGIVVIRRSTAPR